MENTLIGKGFETITYVVLLHVVVVQRRSSTSNSPGSGAPLPLWISLSNSLSCGVLLGTCFLAMWPAAEAKWREVVSSSNNNVKQGDK